MAPLSLAAPTVDNTVGAVFLGMLGACALFGVTSVQAYMYFHNYPMDSHWNKTSVVVLWYVFALHRAVISTDPPWLRILDTLHLTLTIHAMYTYIVKGFESHTQIIHIVWSVVSLSVSESSILNSFQVNEGTLKPFRLLVLADNGYSFKSS